MKEEDFDFGFTTKEDDTQTLQIMEINVKDYKSRMEKLYKTILPLLNNLEKNPEQEIIKWPNRDKKIKDFKQKLKDIMEGK